MYSTHPHPQTVISLADHTLPYNLCNVPSDFPKINLQAGGFEKLMQNHLQCLAFKGG